MPTRAAIAQLSGTGSHSDKFVDEIIRPTVTYANNEATLEFLELPK